MPDPSRLFSFGRFRLWPEQHLLLADETPVRLGGRARDILLALVENAGQVLTKEELIARVWPNLVVEEANLRVHIAALRKALGDGHGGTRMISSVAGRGYCFVGRVEMSVGLASAVAVPEAAAPPSDMQVKAASIVGRTDTIGIVSAYLRQHRCVTIIGPGGIGKTSVALAVAHELRTTVADGVWFVDLSPLTDAALVPTALGSVVGVAVSGTDPLRALLSFLRHKQVLLVLDNCEHVIEAVAELVETLLPGAPGVRILATSREMLRAEGERVFRLQPLAIPREGAALTVAQAMAFPAVQLFVERARQRLDSFELLDSEVQFAVDICRRLDGIPLAIEIAAGRVDAFGVPGLASLLDDRFRLLMRGARTALPRHQTLSLTLDWSYALLPPPEQATLRRLSVFSGSFTMDAVEAVLAKTDEDSREAVACVANLIAKSLVGAKIDLPIAEYRMLDTTRAYALQKLRDSKEQQRFMRRHAAHYLERLEEAGAAWETMPAADWLEGHRHLLNNVRAALDGSFGETGATSIGVALTIAAEPLWFALSLMGECCSRASHALAFVAPQHERQEMRLQAALAWSLMQTKGQVAETHAAWSRVLELAESLGDSDYRLRALWGLWSNRLNNSDFRTALALAEQFQAVATLQDDPADSYVGDRMIGYIQHLLGEQDIARHHIERMLDGYVVPVIGAQIIRFIFDQQLTARCFLARILWLQGFPDRAMRTVEAIVASDAAQQSPLSLCQALVQGACPVALFVGDLAAAERFTARLLHQASVHALDFWMMFGRCFEGVALVRRRDFGAGLPLLENALGGLRGIDYGVYYVTFLAEFAQGLGQAGDCERGIAAIEQAIERCLGNEELWCYPELLRIKGELLLGRGGPGAEIQAEAHFQESLACAQRQGAQGWELRVGISLARLSLARGRTMEVQTVLGPILARFTEGFGGADLMAATALLEVSLA